MSLARRYGAATRCYVEIEANLGRLRFVQLGSILAPIKRTKSGWFSDLCLVESTDSLGRSQLKRLASAVQLRSLATTFQKTYANRKVSFSPLSVLSCSRSIWSAAK